MSRPPPRPLTQAELDAIVRRNRIEWDNCAAADTSWLDAAIEEALDAGLEPEAPPPTRNQLIIVALTAALALLCLGTAFVPVLVMWLRQAP